MKPTRIILLIALLSYQHFSSISQVYLSEGFELGATPGDWSEEPDAALEPWKYRNGGHNPLDRQWVSPDLENDIANNPDGAHTGNSNAIFFLQSAENERTKLVTPELNLEGGISVELSFYLCQIPWIFEGSGTNDVLRIYYKTHADNDWVLLHEYLDPVYEWELQTLLLPNLSSTYYVAFEGHTRWGYGTCIDDVVIEEKGIQHVWIGEIEYQQQFVNYIPSGSEDVPMMRVDFKVFGNSDTAKLDYIHFTSLNTSDSDISTNGVKLFSTETQTFTTDNPLGSPTNFNVSGIASFTGLNYSLPRGQSYLWLTYDVDAGAVHGNTLDAMVAANGILANDTLYPSTDQSPTGYRDVYETRHFEDFEGAHGMTLTGEFEVGVPTGGGGSKGNPDPSEAFSGTKVLGTDLSGIAPYPYDYEPNLGESSSYLATSTTHNAFYYKNLNLFFYRFLNVDANDESCVQVSPDNGANWYTVWESGEYPVSDYQWELQQVEIPDIYSRTDQFKFRFKLGPTDGQNNYSGWNIDDLYLTGEFISKDVGVSGWVYPRSGSGHTANDSVSVKITNYGGAVITDPVPVAYSFNGGDTWTEDIMDQDIPIGDTVVFTFPTKIDLSVPGLYPEVLATTNLPGDQYLPNDSFTTEVYIVPTYMPPHLEDFETDEGFWRASGNDIWEYGTPAGSVINSAASGTKSWATGLSQKYDDLISQKDNIIFIDDFEDDLGWVLEGQFERAQPSTIHPPYYPISPYYCIGTDLTGLADSLYKYENGIDGDSAYTATTPAFDVSGYSNLSVNYSDNINIQAGDSIRLEVSPDNGANWYTLWKNTTGAILNDWLWDYREIPLHDSLSSSTQLKIRFSLYHSSLSGPVAAGWNIDDFSLTGDLVDSKPGYLSSPAFDLTGIAKPVFEAQLWWDTEPDVDGATLQYSLDDGDTWIPVSNTSGYDSYWNWYTGNPVSELAPLEGWSGQSGEWKTVKHLLPPEVIGQDDVQLRLVFRADKFNNQYDGFALDDAKISEVQQDLGVIDILSPESDCDLSPAETFSLRLRNYGIRDMQPGDSIRIGYYIDHEGEIQTGEETILLSQTFPVGTNLDFDLTSVFDFSKSGKYYASAFTIENDPYYFQTVSNDTTTELIEVKKPAVDLGPDISTVRPDTVVLKAYSGVGGLTYKWMENPPSTTDSTFQVSTAGTYYVSVTNELLCEARDTVKIFELIADAGVTDLIAPVSDCELGSGVIFSIRIQNYGTDTIDIGDELPLRYKIDANPVVEETLILTERIYPDSSFEYTFTGPADMSQVKSYSIKAYTELLWDNTFTNDTLSTTIDAWGYTPVELGPDTIIRAENYLLDAGGGLDSYLWQDGSTEQTLLVDSTGLYKVRVQDGSQCENSDSVTITLVYPDIAIYRLSSPTNACGLSSAENIDLYIHNTGTDTLYTGDTIGISYQVNTDTPVNEDFIISREVIPGDSILYVSEGTVNMSTLGIYQFTVKTAYDLDLEPDNDSISQAVELYGFPNMSLGPDLVVNTTDHTLDAGSGYAAYLWHDGSTDQQFIIEHDNQTADSSYSVTVTDGNGCKTHDEVKIGFDIWDISPVSISKPVSNCVLTSEDSLIVLVRNNGSHTIINEQVRIIASVDGGVPVTLQTTLITPLNPGESLEFLFGVRFDLSAEGDHTIRTYTEYGKDADPDNDTLQVTVTHYGELKPELGGTNDSLSTSFPHVLDAGSDYDSYIWNGTPGNRTYSAESPGWYKLEVTNLQGCTGKDSIYLSLSDHVSYVNLSGDLRVYPIPADDELIVEYESNGSENYYLDIYDPMGRKIFVREYKRVEFIRESIDVTGMAKGIYYLILRTEKAHGIKHIIIE